MGIGAFCSWLRKRGLPSPSPANGPEHVAQASSLHGAGKVPAPPVFPWWAGELTPERRAQLLDWCADWVVRKRLEAPVLMFLEMHKPLTTLASVGYAMGQPPLILMFGFRRTEELRLLLSDRDNVEALMQLIERRSRKAGAP